MPARIKYPELQSKEWLKAKYHDEGMTLTTIAALLGCNFSAVSKAMIRCAVERRTSGPRGPFNDLTGQIFGKWKILHIHSRRRCNSPSRTMVRIIYLCECGGCGAIKAISSSALRLNNSIQCRRCYAKDRNNGIKTKHTVRLIVDTIPNGHWTEIVGSARKRGIDIDMTKEDAQHQYISTNKRCRFTGWRLMFVAGKRGSRHPDTTASLDRVDSTVRSYRKDNIQWVHKTANMAKSIMSDTEFITVCVAIADHLENVDKKKFIYKDVPCSKKLINIARRGLTDAEFWKMCKAVAKNCRHELERRAAA